MTAPRASFADLLSLAVECGCSGIELRNDLNAPLFDGLEPETAAEMARAQGLRIFALAEVKSFNQLTTQTVSEAEKLAGIGSACGAESIALIPANDGSGGGESARKKSLQLSLQELIPILESHGLQGFVEPLGFASASLRSKREVVEVIEEIGARDRIKLVHDTFHHFLAQEPEFYPQHTGMVHISGVTNTALPVNELQDKHRVLVTGDDRIKNTAQLLALTDNGYDGPVSMEAFATEVHNLQSPVEPLLDSFQFISSGLAAKVA